MIRPSLFAFILPALLSACGGPRAPVEIVDLPPARDTVLVAWAEVTDAAWMGGSRWAVIAPQDRAVTVIDFDTRKSHPLGGEASHEIEQPFHLFRAGDSLFVADWQRRRSTVWSLNESLSGAVPAVTTLRGVLPRQRDAAGHWYFELGPPARGDGSGNRDSAAIVRTDADFGQPDTIARLAPLDLAEVVADGRRRFERRLLSGQDRWGVRPDGALWVARVNHNRVDWRDTTGKIRRGDELPDKVLPVTEADRELFLSRFPPELRSTAEQIPFVPIKPPFDAALGSPDGGVWLVKSRTLGDSVRNNQVIDQRGVFVREVRHHGYGRLLAIGQGRAIAVETFEHGVRLLQFSIPQ